MGSFSSKMRQSTSENTGNTTKMSESEASPGEAAASERTTGRTDVTNGEKAKTGNVHQEKPKVVQSFGWLVETPVILHTTAKEIKDKGKKPTEDAKGKSINVATYSDGKYLKMAELALPASSATKPKKQHLQVVNSSSSSSSDGKHGSNIIASGCEGNTRKNQINSGQNNNEDFGTTARPGGTYPVGFGVIGKKDSVDKTFQAENDIRSSKRLSQVRGKSPVSFKGNKSAKK